MTVLYVPGSYRYIYYCLCFFTTDRVTASCLSP